MRTTLWSVVAAGGLLFAAPAFAGESQGFEARLARVEHQLADRTAPSARDTQSAVDAYLATANAEAGLVGGPGSTGYDGGFWIRGGSFLLKINLTIQARYEWWDWSDDAEEIRDSANGDLSGFSLPRLTLKLSGDATCDIHYYAELEAGHHGFFGKPNDLLAGGLQVQGGTMTDGMDMREAWIEYEPCPQLAVRMGLVKLPCTRQLMTPPEKQQFVDISLASGYIATWEPGLTDRNRDYGVMVHGVLGCDGEWSYMLTATNGDGPITRNIFDGSTDDNLAYGARVNWDIRGHMGYEEGALTQCECEWRAALGAWAFFYDPRNDHPHTKIGDDVAWGVDAAVGYGGWSLTAAYNGATQRNSAFSSDIDGWSWFGQVGYLFCGTAWEVAARYGKYQHEFSGGGTDGATEWGAAVNYYIDGHADKLTADVSFVSADSDGNPFFILYPGYHATGTTDATMVRFQWQLAL